MNKSQVIDKLIDYGISTIPDNITKKDIPRLNSHTQGSLLYFHSSTNNELISIWKSTFLETITIIDD